MKFDGRSYNASPLPYTVKERILILLASKVMPALSVFLISDRLNTWVWRMLGVKVGAGSVIRVGTHINAPFMVTIGCNSEIHGRLLSRGRIVIGDGVELVEDVFVSTQSHNMNSTYFESIYAPVNFGDYAWIGPRAIVLAGTHLARGSVVAAGGVMTLKATEPWTIYAGAPARPIGVRAPLFDKAG